MGGWFSKCPAAKVTAKVITDPNILRQFEDQIYGIELTSVVPKLKVLYHPVTQIRNTVVL